MTAPSHMANQADDIIPVNAASGFELCEVYGWQTNRHPTKANASLIAKAPDMLALLKDCEESFIADDSYKLLRDACRRLIADAAA